MKITSDYISDIFLNKFGLAFKKNYCKIDQFQTLSFSLNNINIYTLMFL